jgi:hypothetical protein
MPPRNWAEFGATVSEMAAAVAHEEKQRTARASENARKEWQQEKHKFAHTHNSSER